MIRQINLYLLGVFISLGLNFWQLAEYLHDLRILEREHWKSTEDGSFQSAPLS